MSRKVENVIDEGGVVRRVSLLERQTAIGFSGFANVFVLIVDPAFYCIIGPEVSLVGDEKLELNWKIVRRTVENVKENDHTSHPVVHGNMYCTL